MILPKSLRFLTILQGGALTAFVLGYLSKMYMHVYMHVICVFVCMCVHTCVYTHVYMHVWG